MSAVHSVLIAGPELNRLIDQSFGSLFELHVRPELEHTLLTLSSKHLPYAHSLSESRVLYIHPDQPDPIRVRSFNGVYAWVTPRVLGIVSAIYAYRSLSLSTSAGMCLIARRCLSRITKDALSLPETRVIQSLTT